MMDGNGPLVGKASQSGHTLRTLEELGPCAHQVDDPSDDIWVDLITISHGVRSGSISTRGASVARTLHNRTGVGEVWDSRGSEEVRYFPLDLRVAAAETEIVAGDAAGRLHSIFNVS